MKKILLATTVIVGTTGLFAAVAFADAPKVSISGYANFEAGYVSDDQDGKTVGAFPSTNATNANQRPQAFRNDTQVDFKIDGKGTSFTYGGEVDLLADTSADTQGRGTNASKTFIYGAGQWGRLELGSNVGADGTMKVDAGTIARATGGVDGDWSYFANASDPYLAMTALPLAYGQLNAATSDFLGNHTEENLSKITYYTPRFAGVQVGVSYLPDQTNRGQGIAVGTSPNPAGPDRTNVHTGLSANIFTGGINYDNKFGDIGVTLAATGERGNAEVNTFEDLAAWNAGAKLSYMGWSLAGSYGNWGKSNDFKGANSQSTWYWDIGAAYEQGPFGASVTYMQSVYGCGNGSGLGNNTYCTSTGGARYENKFDSVSVGVDYKVASGLTPYAEVTYYDENSGIPVPAVPGHDNKGTTGIIGTQLNF